MIKGYTPYKLWAAEEGIDLKLSPTHTHETNRGAEQAGQEAINKLIKICLGANLPKKLWPKTTLTGIYLYNMSPLETHDMCSPNEVLNS